jgi:hypothetical protein
MAKLSTEKISYCTLSRKAKLRKIELSKIVPSRVIMTNGHRNQNRTSKPAINEAVDFELTTQKRA